MKLSPSLADNITLFEELLPVRESFDMIGRRIVISGREAYYILIDGLSKDEEILKLLQQFQGMDPIAGMESAEEFIAVQVSYIEAETSADPKAIVKAVLSGQMLLLVDGFTKAILLDMRTYPARGPEEPELEKVTRGSRDGLVETVVFNTALIRRRIRDSRLIYEVMEVGEKSKTDVVIGYIKGMADEKLLNHLRDALSNLQTDALIMGEKTLEELLIQKRWYNPFPQAKFTERPDVVAAHLLEGHVVLLVDNSPSAMLFPATMFHFMQHSEDYYQNPLVGTYIRWVRYLAVLISLLFSPLWLLAAQNAASLPSFLSFMVPEHSTQIPLFFQLLLIELGFEIQRMASIHTPSSLSTAMGIIGGLLLGEFAIETGIFIPETILYMAVSGLANYAIPSIEFAMAIRMYRIFLLLMTGIAGGWGFLLGLLLFCIILVTTKSFSGLRYTWPLIPFDRRALSNVLIRKPIVEVKRHERENQRKPIK